MRVSTDMQATDGLSLDAQRHAIQACCTAQGLRLIRIFQDAESGGKVDRAGLAEALATKADVRWTLRGCERVLVWRIVHRLQMRREPLFWQTFDGSNLGTRLGAITRVGSGMFAPFFAATSEASMSNQSSASRPSCLSRSPSQSS